MQVESKDPFQRFEDHYHQFNRVFDDLLIEIKNQPHATFVREGLNIRSDVRVPRVTALPGGKLDAATLRVHRVDDDPGWYIFRSRLDFQGLRDFGYVIC